ncbi:MAG TPA: polysaccharide biosynthesis protein, partial [Dermatophilaceae bacterium]
PAVTRYFMMVQEAVQLVIQAGAIGRDGEALVLDMGQPVRIDDVARMLAAKSRRPVDIVYTGLRPGGKLHEDLLAFGEPDLRPTHPLISHVPVPSSDPLSALGLDAWAAGPKVLASIGDLASRIEPPRGAGSTPIDLERLPVGGSGSTTTRP